MSTIAEKVKKIVVEQLGVAEDQVTEDAKFIEDLGADSLDQVELVMALEEEFGVSAVYHLLVDSDFVVCQLPAAFFAFRDGVVEHIFKIKIV